MGLASRPDGGVDGFYIEKSAQQAWRRRSQPECGSRKLASAAFAKTATQWMAPVSSGIPGNGVDDHRSGGSRLCAPNRTRPCNTVGHTVSRCKSPNRLGRKHERGDLIQACSLTMPPLVMTY
ncbi:hypothetical protein VTO73DRAFT_55 [Trametes versicolor]